jgi:hypothetical protein
MHAELYLYLQKELQSVSCTAFVSTKWFIQKSYRMELRETPRATNWIVKHFGMLNYPLQNTATYPELMENSIFTSENSLQTPVTKNFSTLRGGADWISK